MEKVRQVPRSAALETSIKKESHRIPFVITFNPALPNISQVISSNLNILCSSLRCLEAFPSPPRISYRRCENLRDILVRAKHRRQAPLASVAFRCHRKRCKTCPFISEGTTLFSLPTNKDAHDITSPAILLISSIWYRGEQRVYAWRVMSAKICTLRVKVT